MKYAVIDLNSTGVSLVIAEGEKSAGVFSAVHSERTNISITDYFDGHSLSQRGIDKIIDALISARSTCKAMNADECYVISTAALRLVDNVEEIAEKIKLRTGMTINYLDGTTEAYCDFLSNRKYATDDKVALIDIGGSSVEFCDFKKKTKEEMICLDFGPIKLRNKFDVDIYPTDEQSKRIKNFVRKKSDEQNLPSEGEFDTVVLVGSINGAILAAYNEYCEVEKSNAEFSYEKYKKFCKWLKNSTDRTRLIMKIAPEKINLLPVAAIVLKELLRRFNPTNVVVSDCGVKEGYLSLISLGDCESVPVNLNEDVTRADAEEPKKTTQKPKRQSTKKSEN